jgi:hypothetical protein
MDEQVGGFVRRGRVNLKGFGFDESCPVSLVLSASVVSALPMPGDFPQLLNPGLWVHAEGRRAGCNFRVIPAFIGGLVRYCYYDVFLRLCCEDDAC